MLRATIWLLLAIVLGLAAALPATAQFPSVLCAALTDSSGVAGGTSVGDCDLNGQRIEQTLSSSTFGQFTGNARAVSNGFGHVGLQAAAQFVDYGPGAYVPAPFGIYFAASANARFFDQLGVLAPYPELRLVFRFDISGSLTPPALAAGQLCYGLAYGASPGPGTCTIDLPSTLELLSEPFKPDGTLRDLAFFFQGAVFINDERVPGQYTTAAYADLEHTIAMSRLLVTQPDGTPARGVSLSSAYNIDYPLAPINQLPVPEPATWATLLAGLVLLGWRRRVSGAGEPVRACSTTAAIGPKAWSTSPPTRLG